MFVAKKFATAVYLISINEMPPPIRLVFSYLLEVFCFCVTAERLDSDKIWFYFVFGCFFFILKLSF